MIPKTAPIIQLIDSACQDAISQALHDAGVIKFHKRYNIVEGCPFCPEADPELQKRIEDTMEEIAQGGGDSQLAKRIMVSPALKAHLDEHELVPDGTVEVMDDEPGWVARPIPESDKAQPEQFTTTDGMVTAGSFAEKTVKQLRPLASAAGMKGARVASKAAMVEYLEGA